MAYGAEPPQPAVTGESPAGIRAAGLVEVLALRQDLVNAKSWTTPDSGAKKRVERPAN
jgi:hypothetical protein